MDPIVKYALWSKGEDRAVAHFLQGPEVGSGYCLPSPGEGCGRVVHLIRLLVVTNAQVAVSPPRGMEEVGTRQSFIIEWLATSAAHLKYVRVGITAHYMRTG